MNIEVKLSYELEYKGVDVASRWSYVRVRIALQSDKRVYKPELRYVLAGNADFQAALMPLLEDVIRQAWPAIQAAAANITWPNPAIIARGRANSFSLDSNSGKIIYVDYNVAVPPTSSFPDQQQLKDTRWL